MLIPATRYRDPNAAFDFLRDVFGLEEHAVYRSDDGKIMHAEMKLGTGLMMFGPPSDGPFEAFMADPSELQGRETTTIYAVIKDVQARYKIVCDAGAKVLVPLEKQFYGGSSFSVADLEDHVWTFGDFDPNTGHS